MTAAKVAILVRRAAIADFTAVSRLRNQLQTASRARRPDIYRPLYLGSTEALFQSELAEPDALILVAELAGEVAGFAATYFADGTGGAIGFPRRFASIGSLVVGPQFQNQGAGRALLAAIEKAAHHDGVEVLTLNVDATNDQARAFYDRTGFGVEMEHWQKHLRRVRRIE